MRFILTPEVAGGWGKGTKADTSVHPPIVDHLEYEFDGWLGDELLETFPCFIVTKRLGQLLSSAGLSGFELSVVEVIKSETFDELKPGFELPEFLWLRIKGQGEDDFSLSKAYMLEVSERALTILNQGRLMFCGIEKCA